MQQIKEGQASAYRIPPEVLFTMYQDKDRVKNYLQFVFPEKIAVEYNAQDPRFYTFMTTDQDGMNSFIHVLTFYEEINQAEIDSNDFDIVAELLRKQHLKERRKNQTMKDVQKHDVKQASKEPAFEFRVTAKETKPGVQVQGNTSQRKEEKSSGDPYVQDYFPNVREGSTGELKNQNSDNIQEKQNFTKYF